MNSQTSTLQTALGAEVDKLLGCIHCGLCLPACPTYLQLGNENDSPRGRIYLMRAVAEGRLEAEAAAFRRHIDLCLGCRACETACPAGVRYGRLLEAAREEVLAREAGNRERLLLSARPSLSQRFLKLALRRLFPYPQRLRALFAALRFARRSKVLRLAWREGLIGEVSPPAERALSLLFASAPVYASARDEAMPDIRLGQNGARAQRDGTRLSVSLFTGCVMEGLFAHTNAATARVLAAQGCQPVAVEDQVCCGALHAHAGDLETARALARQNIAAFETRGKGAEAQAPVAPPIIVNAAGCGALLKEYDELLKDDPHYAERARAFSARVRDVTEYLAQIGVRRGAPLQERVTYDAPCHLYHAQRVTTAPQQLMAAIPGLDYAPLEGMADCCGGAGTYNLSEPEMSESLLEEKIANVKATGARMLLTANPGCQMQLGAGAWRFGARCGVAHVIELLDESYRRAGFYQNSPESKSNHLTLAP
jgi:glycolate oxidase iron-sulfur subunit